MRINYSLTPGGLRASGKYDSLRGKGYSILIMTPSRDGKCSMAYSKSLAQTCIILNALDIDVVIGETNNSCFVHHSRNLAANEFLRSNHTHLLQIDDDMSWNPECVLEMLLKDKEFIAGIGRKKSIDVEFAGVNFTDENGIPIGEAGEKETDSIIKMLYIGGAFTLHKKSVFQKLIRKVTHCSPVGFIFYKDEYTQQNWQTEDYYFAQLCRENDIDVWCYPNIDMGHLGNHDYKGNFFTHLKSLKKDEKTPSDILNEIRKLMENFSGKA